MTLVPRVSVSTRVSGVGAEGSVASAVRSIRVRISTVVWGAYATTTWSGTYGGPLAAPAIAGIETASASAPPTAMSARRGERSESGVIVQVPIGDERTRGS